MDNNSEKIDLDSIKVNQNFHDQIGVQKKIVHVPIRKPKKQEFIRVHSSSSYRCDFLLLESVMDRETYILDPQLGAAVDDARVATLLTTINTRGDLFLWPIKHALNGNKDSWPRSAFNCAELSQENWLRMEANLNMQSYQANVASSKLDEPSWPELPFDEIIQIACREQYIKDPSHPVLKRLRGEI